MLSVEVTTDMDLQEQGLDEESLLDELEKEEEEDDNEEEEDAVGGVSYMAQLEEIHPDNPPVSPFKTHILYHKEVSKQRSLCVCVFFCKHFVLYKVIQYNSNGYIYL